MTDQRCDVFGNQYIERSGRGRDVCRDGVPRAGISSHLGPTLLMAQSLGRAYGVPQRAEAAPVADDRLAAARPAASQAGMAATSGTTMPKRSPIAARLATCTAAEDTTPVLPRSGRVAVALATTVGA
jgi:hypothetical protein